MHLRVDADHLEHTTSTGESWRIRVSDIRLLGEFLSRQHRGPENHFLVFMTQDEWFKAPYDSEGRDACLAELGQRLGHPLRPDLFKATTFSSRVLWPAHLEGHAVFELIPEERAGSILTRVRQIFLQKVGMRFTDEVRKELRGT